MRTYLGISVIYPSEKPLVEGCNYGLTIPGFSSYNSVSVRVYVEKQFPKAIINASLEFALEHLNVKSGGRRSGNGWKALLEVEGFFPSINTAYSKMLEEGGYEFLLVGGLMEGDIAEHKLEEPPPLKDFSSLSRKYTYLNNPSSSILNLLNETSPLTYTFNGVGVYLVIERKYAKKVVSELLKIFDPEEIVVVGLDNRCIRTYKVSC